MAIDAIPAPPALRAALQQHQLGNIADAVRGYQRVIHDDPQCAEAYHLLGIAAYQLDDPQGSLELLEHSLPLYGPSREGALLWTNLGAAYRVLCETAKADAAFDRAIRIDPSMMLPRCHRIMQADTDAMETAQSLLARRVAYSEHLPRLAHEVSADISNYGSPLRVGFVGGNFNFHSAAFGYVDILANTDDPDLEYIIYNTSGEDAFSELFKGGKAFWRSMQRAGQLEFAAQIRKDRVGILVDLMGHTPDNRLDVFALKPAPIQVSAWGYACGTGLSEMDYLITDEFHCPAYLARQGLVETPLYLSSFMGHQMSPIIEQQMRMEKAPREFKTFGYFGSPRKLNALVFDAWNRILDACPDWELLLKYETMDREWTQSWVLSYMAKHRDRIRFIGRTPHAEHVHALSKVTIMLDSFPHGGGVSLFEALLCGCIPICIVGDTLPGRTGYSILRNANLDLYYNEDIEHYIEFAVASTGHRPSPDMIQSAVSASPACQTVAYRQEVAETFKRLWHQPINQ